MSEIRDEVSYTDFLRACRKLEHLGAAMRSADPDEMAEHWLPELTRCEALIFSFVGSNMTARHVPGYQRTVAELQAAKDRAGGVDYDRPTPS